MSKKKNLINLGSDTNTATLLVILKKNTVVRLYPSRNKQGSVDPKDYKKKDAIVSFKLGKMTLPDTVTTADTVVGLMSRIPDEVMKDFVNLMTKNRSK